MTRLTPTPAISRTSSVDSGTLEQLVGDRDVFLTSYWNKRPLHSRSARQSWSEYLTVEEIEAVLTSTSLREPYVRLAREGKVVDERRFLRPLSVQGTALRGVVDSSKLADEFTTGSTVLLDSLDHYMPRVRTLCDRLGSELLGFTEAVAFATPPSNEGLHVHHDNAEVFVLQVAGQKNWEVYEQVRPLPQLGGSIATLAESPILSVQLQPGELLYIPWGCPHVARCTDTSSVHLSITVRPATVAKLLESMIKEALTVDSFEPIPTWNQTAQELGKQLQQRCADSLSVAGSLDPTAFSPIQRARDLTVQVVPARLGFLTQAAHALALDDQTVLARNPAVPFHVDASGDRCILQVDGKKIALPKVADVVLRQVAGMTEASFEAVRGTLSPENGRKVVACLINAGVLHAVR